MDKQNADSDSANYRKRTMASMRDSEDSDMRSNRSGRSRAGSAKSGGSKRSAGSGGKSPGGKSKSKKSDEGGKHYDQGNRKLTPELSKKCWGQGFKVHPQACGKPPFKWQEGKYVRDECGSGMVPYTRNFHTGRSVWCKTPLTMYQATHGELGRQILCREKMPVRDIRQAPPCNMCTNILPLCRGYYRKYECVRPCEEMYAITDDRGQKDYRDVMQRYWDPCLTEAEKGNLDVNTFAHHNVALGMKMKRQLEDQPCW